MTSSCSSHTQRSSMSPRERVRRPSGKCDNFVEAALLHLSGNHWGDRPSFGVSVIAYGQPKCAAVCARSAGALPHKAQGVLTLYRARLSEACSTNKKLDQCVPSRVLRFFLGVRSFSKGGTSSGWDFMCTGSLLCAVVCLRLRLLSPCVA